MTLKSSVLVSIIVLFLIMCLNSCDDKSKEDLFTDPRDGNVYHTVTIGSQVWMAENLDYRPDSGSVYLNDDSLTFSSIYGRLYNWNTAVAVAPPGWHLPSKYEWDVLLNHLGGPENAGKKLKATGSPWNEPNIADNSSGFSALPGGGRDELGYFEFPGYHANFWSSTETVGSAWYCSMYYSIPDASVATNLKQMYYSVRCVQD